MRVNVPARQALTALGRAVRPGAPVLAGVTDSGPPAWWPREVPCDDDALAEVRAALPHLWLSQQWVADLSAPVRTAKVTRGVARLLTVAGPLDAEQITAAWARQAPQYGHVPLPTGTVTNDWLEAHALFTAADRGGALPRWVVAGPIELDPVTRTLRDVLSAHPGGLSRAALRDGCLKAGMNAATFAVACTYSPVLAHPGRDVWVLTGREAAAVLPATRSPRSRSGAATAWTWAPDGALEIGSTVTRTESTVVHIPAAVCALLEGRDFTISSSEGGRGGQVSVANGLSWGYHRFLRGAGARVGDRLLIRFHLASSTADLRVTTP